MYLPFTGHIGSSCMSLHHHPPIFFITEFFMDLPPRAYRSIRTTIYAGKKLKVGQSGIQPVRRQLRIRSD
jgi:hypothetical protein